MARHVHEVWVITGARDAIVCCNGHFCIYSTERKAIQEAAKLMEEFPDKEYSIKATTIDLPWKS